MDELNERGEIMSNMRELIPELDLIDIKRTSLIPAEKPKRDPAPIRKKRNKAIDLKGGERVDG